jgi:hypothetical protein
VFDGLVLVAGAAPALVIVGWAAAVRVRSCSPASLSEMLAAVTMTSSKNFYRKGFRRRQQMSAHARVRNAS